MDYEVIVQELESGAESSVADALSQLMEGWTCERLGVAVAYATSAGFRTLSDLLAEAADVQRSQWLFGLDDHFTHPAAIEMAQAFPRSTVRLAGARLTGQRFHPKVIWLGSEDLTGSSSLLLGSANLTQPGLSGNVEAAATLQASSPEEAGYLQAKWDRVWATGTAVREETLDEYRAEFEERSRERSALGEEADQEEAVARSSAATVCWVEVGKITGFRAEQLEIIAEQAPFFDLPPHEGPTSEVDVRLQDGSSVTIPVRWFENHMWRFILPEDIPEVEDAGLRPGGAGGERSPYVAVFTRDEARDELMLEFIRDDSQRYDELQELSERRGILHETQARKYGWF